MGIGLAAIFVLILLLPIPKPLFQDPYSTVIQDQNGELLDAVIASDGQWRFPQSDSIPLKFETALLLFEDEYFFKHPGVNPISLFRALRQNIAAGKVVSGGSTLTMQLVRIARGNQPRNIWQKGYETLLALKLDLFYSKDEILNLYSSHAPFGGNVVGLSAASWRYFGRPPNKLSWAEAASLAVLPNNPAVIFPGRNDSVFRQKRDKLLDKISQRGVIDDVTNKLSKAERLPQKPKILPALADHLLFRAYKEGHHKKRLVTTLQKDLQRDVKNLVDMHSENLKGNEVHNAAAIVLNIATGATLAYVGNSTGKDGLNGHDVDIITAVRSPGSLLKPVLYAASMDEGLLMPEELMTDVPLFYKGFVPKNFDKKFRGVVPANEALARSLNVPFVVLLRDYTYEKFHLKLKNVGITSLNRPPGHYGLSMVLGGADMSLWDLTAMYAGLMRVYNNYLERETAFKYRESDYHSNHYTKFENTETPLERDGIIRVEAIWYMLQAMQEVTRPEDWTGWQQFSSARDIAWKTGTSHGFKDGWAIGMNRDYLVGVWTGNADGEGRPGLTGVKAAAPLMFNIFELLPETENPFIAPPMPEQRVCTKSGMIATENCPSFEIQNLPEFMVQGKICTFHEVIYLDKTEKHQVNSACYPTEDMVAKNWFRLTPTQGWYYKSYDASYEEPPGFLKDCPSVDEKEFMEFIYPKQFSRVYIPREIDGDGGRAIFEVAHKLPGTTIYWHLDEKYLGSTTSKHQMGITADTGNHTISLVDEDGNMLQQNFEVINDRI